MSRFFFFCVPVHLDGDQLSLFVCETVFEVAASIKRSENDAKMTVLLVLYVTIYYYYYYTVKGSLQLQENEGLARTANLITVGRVYFSRGNDFSTWN